MLVRGPVHGMQGLLENQVQSLYPQPACPRSGPMKFLGTRLGLRKRPARASAHCLRRLTRTLSQGERDSWTKIPLSPSLRARADVALDGSKISFRLRRGYARKSIKGEKLPTQNPEDPLYQVFFLPKLFSLSQ